MELETRLLIATLHAMAGAVFVAGTYKALEYRLQAGILFGLGFTLAVLATNFTVGPLLFSLTIPELEAAIWSATLGAFTGITAMVAMYEPELDSESNTTDITDIDP